MNVVPRSAWRRARPLVVAAALLVAACAPGTSLQAWARNSDPPGSFAPLVRRVLPSVVNIAVTEVVSGSDILSELPPELRGTPFERQFRERFRNRREQMMGAGSGVIVDPSGIIVTNNHVVGHADKIVVSLVDGTELPARVIGSDELTDIAVIKVAASRSLPAVSWGDSHQLEVGDWILAAGNPFGLGGSVTVGIISARGRDIGAGPFDDFLQLDAPINPGNSGGPTFNLNGELVGINTAIVSPSGGSVGIGFAIPSEVAQPIVERLRSGGHIDRGWLGVSVQDLPGEGKGVAIAGVERNGPAARAGVRAGDVVTAVNGEHVDSARNLIKAVAATPPGNNVRLTVHRQGRDMEVPVTIGRRPAEQAG
ncbi:MAG: trypsin-like peptidase domain-containing protein [Alphaproteobacteria bacterium]|nr:trypsin-like peptidase domain-containing protein [Alphaproteobacteria bacterium]